MKGVFLLALSATLFARTALPAEQAEKAPGKARIPLLIVEAGQSIDAARLAGFAAGLPGPSLFGPALADRLGFFDASGKELAKGVLQSFAAAQDRFFFGQHDQARSMFERLIADVMAVPAALSQQPKTRELIFKARMHLAIIENGAGNPLAAEEQLRRAAVDFPEMDAAATEFPPWIGERLRGLKEQLEAPSGGIVLKAPADCSLMLSGRSLHKGKRFRGIPSGSYGAQVFCAGYYSVAQRLTVSEGALTEFRPLLLKSSRVVFSADGFALSAPAETSDQSLLADLIAAAEYGRWRRVAAIVGRAAQTELWLIDCPSRSILRQVIVPSQEAQAVGQAAELLVRNPSSGENGLDESPDDTWFKDGLAWALLGVGAASLGAGVALWQIYGAPSREEPWIWTMTIGGAGLLGTGVLLFTAPSASKRQGQIETRETGVLSGLSFEVEF